MTSMLHTAVSWTLAPQLPLQATGQPLELRSDHRQLAPQIYLLFVCFSFKSILSKKGLGEFTKTYPDTVTQIECELKVTQI